MQTQRSGFSLVELSIVLVILGLLVGGIMTGQNLIKAAELRAVSTEISKYSAAVYTFRDKYMAMPGDMPNATAFWDAADGGDGIGSDCTYTDTQGTTCNGDGDGNIILTDNYAEAYLFWEHLNNAGMVEGSYTGSPDCAAMGLNERCASFNVNIPSSKFSNAGWHVNNIGNITAASTWMWEGAYGNSFFFGAMNQSGGGVNDIPENDVLTPEDLWNIDTKSDDGRPGTGRVRPYENRVDCVTSTDPDTAEYLLSNSDIACNFIVNILP